MLTFITFTTGSYTDMTKNLLMNFEQVLLQYGHRIIVICMDFKAAENLQEYKNKTWVVFEVRNLNQYDDVCDFNTPSFITLMNFKPILIREFLNSYDELYWTDSDIVFYSDPVPYINDHLIFQQDCPNNQNRYCAGNFYIKKTPEVMVFLDEWIDAIQCNPTKHDQEILNIIIKDGKISPAIFPVEKFQRGYDAFKLKWWHREDKVCIHFNYIEGKDNKIEGMKKINAWYVI